MRIISIDIYFAEEVKLCTIFTSSKLFYFCISSWLLVAKLIAWEGKNSKPRGLSILSMEFLQLLIILVSETSLRGYIDDENNMASIFVK